MRSKDTRREGREMKYEVTEEMIDERISAMAWCLFEDFSVVDVSDALGIGWGHRPTFDLIKQKAKGYESQVEKVHAYAVGLIEMRFSGSEIRDAILEDLEMDEMERRKE